MWTVCNIIAGVFFVLLLLNLFAFGMPNGPDLGDNN